MLSHAVVLVGAAGRSAFGGVDELIPIANRPLLFHTLEALRRAGIRKVVLVASSATLPAVQRALEGQDWELDLRYGECPGPPTLASAQALAAQHLRDEPFLLHLGGCLTTVGLGRLLCPSEIGPLGAVVLADDSGPYDTENVVDLVGGRLAAFGARTKLSQRQVLGVAAFGTGALQALDSLAEQPTPELELVAAVERLMTLGGRVQIRQVDRAWRHSGQPNALLDANRFVLDELRPSPHVAAGDGVSIQGTVVVDPSAHLESTIIRGPSVIGPHARLCEAYIGPYTAVGAYVLVEGAEIEHSILLPGATISHLGRRLEASIIGPKAKIFRDFRLPRALRLRVGEGAEVSLA